MKITGGLFKNSSIAAPKGLATRPTPSKVREAVFNICQMKIEGARFLDLFAGSGIMTLEALSRGAKSSLLIDNSQESKRSILKNIQTFSLQDKATFVFGDVLKKLDTLAGSQFDVIYADPPYGKDIGKKLLHLIDRSSLLSENGRLFIEEGEEIETGPLVSLELADIRTYGLTKLHQFKRQS